MPRLSARYWGMVWYLANSACHWPSDSGGKTPVTGFHSTMERPDSVRRVAPPITSVRNTQAATASSQARMMRVWSGEDGAWPMEASTCLRWRGPYRSHPGAATRPSRARRYPRAAVTCKTVPLHDHPHPQADRRRGAPAPRHGVGTARHGVGRLGTHRHQFLGGDALLFRCRTRLGGAGDAVDTLDVEAER